MKNIVLVGMPGCGKSTVGVVLAKTLGIGFVDTDLCIQQREKRLLQDIIDKDGLEAFLDKEMETILAQTFENCVIATGGSAVLRDRTMQKLKENGTVVFIDVDAAALSVRLRNIKTRGIAAAPGESIADIAAERLPFYHRYADITVQSSGSVSQVVEKIIAQL